MHWCHALSRGKIPSLISPAEAQVSWAIHHHPDSLPSPSIVHAHTLSLSSANSLESSTASLNHPWPSCSTCTYLPDICLKWWLLFLSRSIYLGALTQDSCSLLMVGNTYYPQESIAFLHFEETPIFFKAHNILLFYSTFSYSPRLLASQLISLFIRLVPDSLSSSFYSS